MSAESELLDDIFGSHKYWTAKSGTKYRLHWCDHCEVWTLICPACKNNGCNGGGCKACSGADWDDWKACKYCFEEYLSDEERQTVRKIQSLKKFIPECLAAGFSEINWRWLYEQGLYCQADFLVFPELKELQSCKERVD